MRNTRLGEDTKTNRTKENKMKKKPKGMKEELVVDQVKMKVAETTNDTLASQLVDDRDSLLLDLKEGVPDDASVRVELSPKAISQLGGLSTDELQVCLNFIADTVTEDALEEIDKMRRLNNPGATYDVSFTVKSLELDDKGKLSVSFRREMRGGRPFSRTN